MKPAPAGAPVRRLDDHVAEEAPVRLVGGSNREDVRHGVSLGRSRYSRVSVDWEPANHRAPITLR